MSSGGEDVPEELLWRGDVDDGHSSDYFGGDDDLGSLYDVMRRDTIGGDSSFSRDGGDNDEEEDDIDDDPLGGLTTLGSIQIPFPVEEEEEEEEEKGEGKQQQEQRHDEEEEEEDFVKILEASIQRDLPKVEISKEFQSMLDAVEEDIAQGGDGLVDGSHKDGKSESNGEGGSVPVVEHDDEAGSQDVEDSSLPDIGKLASSDTTGYVERDETEKLNELLQGLILESKHGGGSRGRDGSQLEDTFWQLQAVCSKILKAREKVDEYQKLIKALDMVLHRADIRGLQECLDYVLFPFGIILDAFISGQDIFEALKRDSIVCDTLICLETLVSKLHLDEGRALSLTQRLASMLALPKERLSEEPRKRVSCILAKMFSTQVESAGDPWLGHATHRPLIGSVISILLCHPYNDATVPSGIAIDVQKSSLDALELFLRAVGNADSLAFFVPGVVTGLVKRIMVQIDENVASGLVRSKNSSGVISSLKVMQELFVQVFSDEVVEPLVDKGMEDECQTHTIERYQSMLEDIAKGLPREEPSTAVADTLSNLEANIQTDREALHVHLSWAWIQATVIRISTFLQIVVPKLTCHDNAAVRLQVAEIGSCILQRCLIAFKDNGFILDALLLLGQDSWPSVKSAAAFCLSSYFEETKHNPSIDFGDSIASLPTVLKESERKGKAEALRVCSYIEYSHLSAGNSALHILNSAEGRDRLLNQISTCLDIDLQSLLIVARGPLLAIMDTEFSQCSNPQQTHLGRSSMPDCLKYMSSKDTYAAFAKIIHQLVKIALENDISKGKVSGSCYTGLVASCLKNITDALGAPKAAKPWQIEVSKLICILTEVMDGSVQVLESENGASFQKNALACCKNAVLDILYTLQEQHIWLLRTAFSMQKTKIDDQDTLNSILQHYCLDLIGVAARCLKTEFSADGKCMHVAMLPVIEKFASEYQYVSASAKCAIQCICAFCGYENGLEELIQKNIDYVVDGMCVRLRQPSVYPDAPRLFAALLKQNGVAVALMPLLSEPADHSIKGISIIHRREKSENVLSFVLCTLEIAKGARSVAVSAREEMEALARRILTEEVTKTSTHDAVQDPENPTIEDIADYFQTKRNETVQKPDLKHIDVSPDVWECIMLCKRKLSSAASLAQSIADSVGPLSVSKSLPVAIQSFKAAVQALHALDMAHTGLEIFKKQLEERIECKGQIPVVDTKAAPTFLPSIHLLWTPLMGSMNDWRTPVLEEAIECLRDILLLAPGFLARRFTKEAWPKLKKLLEQGAPQRNLIVPGHDDSSSPALDARMQRAVLNMIIKTVSKLTQEECVELFLPISREIMRDIIRISRKNQDKITSSIHNISESSRDCYAAMASVNPDAAWAILYENGGISHDITFTDDITDLKEENASVIIASLQKLPLPPHAPSPWDVSVLTAMQRSLLRAI